MLLFFNTVSCCTLFQISNDDLTCQMYDVSIAFLWRHFVACEGRNWDRISLYIRCALSSRRRTTENLLPLDIAKLKID